MKTVEDINSIPELEEGQIYCFGINREWDGGKCQEGVSLDKYAVQEWLLFNHKKNGSYFPYVDIFEITK